MAARLRLAKGSRRTRRSSIEQGLDAIRAGRMIIVVDDEDRENEGDLTMAASAVTPDAINFMAKFGRGLVCLAMTPERLDQLEIPLETSTHQLRRDTAFCVSIDAQHGTTTGISAADRAHTVKVAIDPMAKPADLARPDTFSATGAERRYAVRARAHGSGRRSVAHRGLAPAGDLRDHERRRHDGACRSSRSRGNISC